MKRILKLWFTAVFCGLILFPSCTETENTSDEDLKNTYIADLQAKKTELTDLMNSVEYGGAIGQYPESSKTILEDAIAALDVMINDFMAGNDISDENYYKAISDANLAKTEFSKTINQKDDPSEFTPVPAELLVNGQNGGCIDFGYSEEFFNFGEDGKAQFTVDLWVKLDASQNFMNLLGTYRDEGTEINGDRGGWFINYFDGKKMRFSMATTYYHGLVEPGTEWTDYGNWVHVAAVLDENTSDVDDNGHKRVVTFYINGEEKEKASAEYNYQPNKYETHLMAFCAPNREGGNYNNSNFGNGYIKDVHLWSKPLSADEIKALYEGAVKVTADNEDLIAGWEFTATVADNSSIPDITGKFSARLSGDYTWKTLEEDMTPQIE